MVSCKRCKHDNWDSANYCFHCGIPLKLEILEMVRRSYEQKRKIAVHSMISVLLKEGCIKEDKLAELMEKLKNVFNPTKMQKDPLQK